MNASLQQNLNAPYLKMLIVDDEPLMRQGFRVFFDWERYMISNVIEAESGIEAICISEVEKPDIVISDIRMPEIDGLELITKLKEILPKATFIVISGYDDFEYAKKSIALGVFHYLVKPIQSSELHDVMNKCIAKIEDEKRRKVVEDELNLKLEEALPVIRNNFLLNILVGSMTDNKQDCLHKLEQLGLDIIGDNYNLLMIASCNDIDSSYSTKSKTNIMIKEAFESCAYESKIKSSSLFKYYILMDVDYIKVIFSWDTGTEIVVILKKFFQCLAQKLKDSYDIELVCSSGTNKKDIIDIHISTEEAAKILEYKLLKGEPGLWLFEEVKGFETGRPFFLSRLEEKKLLASVENNDIESIKQIMSELNQNIKKLDYISVEYIYSTLLEMIISVTRVTFESGMNDNSFNPKIFAYDYFRNFKNTDEIFKWMESYITNISERFYKFRMSKPRKLIEEITAYITQNIHMEISLNKVAERFYYNPSYLSRLFKDEMNTNFMEYLNKIKIQMAIELLNSNDMTAIKICEKVGYKDYKYFTTVFRKYTGKTPNEYKSQRSRKT